MPLPVASYQRTVAELSVQFTDSSANLPTSWAWNFGDGQTSTLQNPTHTYSTAGVYNTVLTSTNNDGSNTVVGQVVVSIGPMLNQSIADLVKSGLLGINVPVKGDAFQELIHYWQLWLQPGFRIPDADVFNEAKWPPLVNVLISKLIIHDLILRSVSAAAISTNVAQASAADTAGQTVQVCDYQLLFDLSNLVADTQFSLTINSITIDGQNFTNSPAMNTRAMILTWLNGLGKGVFTTVGTFIKTLATPVIPTTANLTYTNSGGSPTTITANFAASNCTNLPIGGVSGGTTGGGGGAVKKVETGPASVEFFDSTSFWATFFKSTGASGSSSGVFQSVIADICGLASRVRIKLPMCTLTTSSPLFRISKLNKSSFGWGLTFGYSRNPYEYYQDAINTVFPISLQYINQTVVQVNHGMGRFPYVKIHSQTGNTVVAAINHLSLNIFEVQFMVPSSGTIEYF